MLGYLTENLPQVELKVTGFDYQGSLEDTDITGYDVSHFLPRIYQ